MSEYSFRDLLEELQQEHSHFSLPYYVAQPTHGNKIPLHENMQMQLLGDLYFLPVYTDIDTNAELTPERKAELINQLKQFDSKHRILLSLRNFYYCSLEQTLLEIDEYTKCVETSDNPHPVIDFLEDVFSLLGFQKRNLHSKIFMYAPILAHHFESEIGDANILASLIQAISNLITLEQKRGWEENEQQTFWAWLQFFTILQENSFRADGKIAYLVFLSTVFDYICTPDNRTDFTHNLHAHLRYSFQNFSYLANRLWTVTRDVQHIFDNGIYSCQKSMCALMTTTAKPDAYINGHIQHFYQACKTLYNDSTTGFRTLLSKFYEIPSGCMATMIFFKRKYGAISGAKKDSEERLAKAIATSNGYKLIPISDEVRYYSGNEYITYKDYTLWKAKTGSSNKYNRMFSCCERKLLTKLYGRKKGKCTMYVTKTPCYMCLDALNSFAASDKVKIKLKYADTGLDKSLQDKKDRDEIFIVIKKSS